MMTRAQLKARALEIAEGRDGLIVYVVGEALKRGVTYTRYALYLTKDPGLREQQLNEMLFRVRRAVSIEESVNTEECLDD